MSKTTTKIQKRLSSYSMMKKIQEGQSDIHLLTSEEIQSVQKILLSIMDDICFVCKKYDLTYVMYGGCQLGQMRNGGFIPWDDDMDVVMPRRDYNQFRQLFINEFREKYYIQEIRSCQNYDLGFMKVRKNGTVFCEPLDPEPEKSGVFIDIFPMENVFENPVLRTWQYLLTDGLQFVCSCIRVRKKEKRMVQLLGNHTEDTRTIRIKSIIAIPFCIIPFRRWLLWMDRAASICHNDQSKMVSVPMGSRHFKGEMFPREWFFPVKESSFEDREYDFVHNPEKYLSQIYGPDWITPPPEKEWERHALWKFQLPDKTL